MGDLHGRAGALDRLLRHLKALSVPGERRDLVFLGDLVDRGPESLRAARLAVEAREWVDRLVLLPGNHELMLLDALDEGGIVGEPAASFGAASLWRRNGGEAALREVDPKGRLRPHEALEAFRAALPEGFERAMREGPTHHEAGDFLLVHAGLDPHAERAAFLDWTGGWGADGRGVVVHGHTPATHRPIRTPREAEAFLDAVASHGRLCLDAGAAMVDQVAAAEVVEDRYRLHVALAP